VTDPILKKTVSDPEITPTKEVATRNFFATLKTSMETESTSADAATPEETDHRQTPLRWFANPQQNYKMYRPLHCRKKQVSQFRLLM
jgi:hypothetical protein